MPYKEIRYKEQDKFYERLHKEEKKGWIMVGYNLTLGAVKVGVLHKVATTQEEST